MMEGDGASESRGDDAEIAMDITGEERDKRVGGWRRTSPSVRPNPIG
jgi:hypothetical protein